MNMTTSPKNAFSSPPAAFISHASEDKTRFVTGFTERLRAAGIDAWFDKWEIKVGDSLVQKIFEEGIKNASVFIVVISSSSITKPWVREELDSGMVKKIQGCCRLIPLIIDDCQVPIALQHLKWVKIADLTSYETELSEIKSAIFGMDNKPPIGRPPPHVIATVIDYLPDLTKTDNLVFGVLGRYYLTKGESFFQTADVFNDLMALGFSESEVDESLKILNGRGYIKTSTIQGYQIWGIQLYPFSLDAFIRTEVQDYDWQLVTILSKIVNEDQSTSTEIHESTKITIPIILHALDLLKSKGLITLTGPAGFPIRIITSVSPELKRILH